ncbi:MAG: GerW family sporulation protein, partial [Lachnospiraceae bacterium]|nr:GerW family sporulation protein [Lachnospiraceae bacterium]
AGGLTGKMTPSAVLVIKDGNIKLVNIKNQDVMTKILDMVPDIVAKAKKKDPKVTEEEVNDMLDKASEVKPEEKE